LNPFTLQVQGLVKHFDGVQAVKGVSLDVAAGECVALIGPNGAGKSTCFACIAGQQDLTSGAVQWGGQAIHGWPPARRLRAGVARTFQVAQTFEALTALQNVKLSVGAHHGFSAFSSIDSEPSDHALQLLLDLGLQDHAQHVVGSMSYGARKRLELAIALAGLAGRPAEQTLLLLDEPAAGLAVAERAQLMALVKAQARKGVAVLYTEHNMDAVFGVADRVLVLIDGELAAQGLPQDIARNQTVLHRYLGRGFQQGRVEHA
jgi:branched-chain amino acid transport system ATP-binding protein